MPHTSIEPAVLAKAEVWTKAPFDEATRTEVEHLIQHDPDELTERFYTELEFGTGGLRGIMGAGTNRVNRYTIAMATQGLFNYLRSQFPKKTVRLAIAYDSRTNSRQFAEVTADVLASNGAQVYLFSELRPTPELSFALRQLGCQSGVVITASHNPKEYNGYKVYWEDGAQVIPPHDKGIIAEVRKVTSMSMVKMGDPGDRVRAIAAEIDKAYLDRLSLLSLSKGLEEQKSKLKIAFTALHGSGITLVPPALKAMGFEQVQLVKPQDQPDGNFPTVDSPNPEEREALEMAIAHAEANGCDLVLGTDPDCDRVGIAARDGDSFRLMNGNETFVLLAYYHLQRWKDLGRLQGKEYIAKTIVTTDLVTRICADFGVKLYETLTGFKYIAGVIREQEDEHFIMGGEESYGYLSGDFVRDKDGAIASCMIAEVAAWAMSKGQTLPQLLEEIHRKYGVFQELLVSVKKEGRQGKEEIAAMMESYRSTPPASLGGSKVVKVHDVRSGKGKNLETGESFDLGLPSSNVVQFFLEDGGKVTARPSGTEPKIKFYFSLRHELKAGEDYRQVVAHLARRAEDIRAELGI